MENSNDIAYQIMRRNDNTLEIPKAILELKHMFIICLSYAHNMVIIYFNDKSLRNKYIAFCVFGILWFVFYTLLTNTCCIILISWLCSKSTTKTAEQCHVLFIFNFEHIQEIKLIFILLTLNICWTQDKIYKTRKPLKIMCPWS